MILHGKREGRLATTADQAIPRQLVPLGKLGPWYLPHNLADPLMESLFLSLSLYLSDCLTYKTLTLQWRRLILFHDIR